MTEIVPGAALTRAAHQLLPLLEQGQRIDAPALRIAMGAAFGGSDTDGAWDWKTAYDVCEGAAVLFLRKYGKALLRKAGSPAAALPLLTRIAGLQPSHTRRSEESEAFQQFSTPIPLGFAAATAAAAAFALPADLITNLDPGSAVAAEDAQPVIPIVDTHQHLWDLKKLNLPWLKNEGVKSINRDFLMKDYLEATRGLGVTKTVYMEVNVRKSDQDLEAEWVIGMCRDKSNPMKAAVIGGYPHDRGFKKYIRQYEKSDYVRGVRTVLHDADRPKGLCLENRFVKNVRLLGKMGMSYDLCMRPDELTDGARLVEKCPGTRFVLDHCGNMPVGSDDAALRKKWMAGIKALASHENVVCKISGIVVTAPEGWKAADLAPNMLYCIDTFGEDRAYFAGDWPVCRLRATFAQWVAALKTIVKDRPIAAQKKLFAENAEKFYRI